MNNELKPFFKRHGIITVSEAKAIGVSRAMLARWAAAGELQRLSQGVYAPADEIPDELLVISQRSPRIVFSHETALALHKLHNRIPALPSFTIPTGSRSPRSLDGAVVVYHVRERLHGLGRTVVKSFLGHDVPCYDAERTICDVVRSRTRMDVETYVGAIRAYASSPKRNLPLLFKYARKMGIEKKVHEVLEVIV